VLAEKAGRADLAAIREARLAVQASPPRQEREARRGEHPDERHRARPQDPSAHRGPIGVVVAVPDHGQRRGTSRIKPERCERQHSGELACEDERRDDGECRLEDATGRTLKGSGPGCDGGARDQSRSP